MKSSMTPTPFLVESIRQETHDIVTLHLSPQDNSGVTYQPGQFNMIYLFGQGEVPISVSGGSDGLLVHTVRNVGTVTAKIAGLDKGNIIGIRGPYGRGWPMEEARGKDVIIAAGGIGLAPLRPVIHAVLADREKYGKVVLLYGTRTPDDILFQDELHEWLARFDVDVIISVDRSLPGWHGHVGVIPDFIAGADFDPGNCIAMVCGPEIMMNFTIKALQARKVQNTDIHVSMERNMKCAIGQCGHCQYGPFFICKDGPVFPYPELIPYFGKKEL